MVSARIRSELLAIRLNPVLHPFISGFRKQTIQHHESFSMNTLRDNRMKSFSTCILVTLLAFCVVPVSVDAAVVTNGGFETPNIPDGFSFDFFSPGQTIGAGWTVDPSSTSAILVMKSGLAGAPTTSDGGQFALLSDGVHFASIYQDIAIDSGDYRLSFQLANGASQLNEDAGVQVNLVGSGGSVTGGLLDFLVPGNAGFQNQSFAFTAPQHETYRLTVTATIGTVAVDAFSIQQISTIPEPSSVFVLAAMALPLATRRRR